MADKKNDKSNSQDASMKDSGELLKEVFGLEVDALTLDGKVKPTAEKGNIKSEVKEPKSPSQRRGVSTKRAGYQIASEKRKIVKSYPIFQSEVDKRKRKTSEKDTSLKKTVEEKTAPQGKIDKLEEVRAEESIEVAQIKGGRVGFGGYLGLTSDKLKVALLSVLLVAAIVFLLSSLGVVDFGHFLGLSKPTKNPNNRTQVAEEEPAKRSTHMTAKSTQKAVSPNSSDKTAFQQRKRIVGMPSKAAPSKELPPIIKSQTKPITSARKPVIAQTHHESTASVHESVVSKQGKLVPKQPVKPATITQKLSVSKTPAQPVGSAQRPVVAKKQPEISAPKFQPVVKAPSGSAGQTQKTVAFGKEEVFSAETALSYPYSIYLGSFKIRQRAEKAIRGYRKKGLSPYWVKIDLGGKGVWYRVYCGYFQKRQQANEFIEEKKIEEAESRHTRYTNLIGVFNSQEERDKEKIRLSNLELCPYVIPGPKGQSRLYVGAFYQRRRAEKQRAELTSKGISSEVVER